MVILLVVALTIFELVTFAKVKPHPTSSIMRSAIYQAMTCLIFVAEVGRIRKGHVVLRCHQLVLPGIL